MCPIDDDDEGVLPPLIGAGQTAVPWFAEPLDPLADDRPPRPSPSLAVQSLVAAGLGLGRLDRAWSRAPPAVRACWLRGLLDREAAATAALEGWHVGADELLAEAHDCRRGPPSLDLRPAGRCRALLAAVSRRSAAQLYTPNRLAALARRDDSLRAPGWAGDGLEEARWAALSAALAPGAVASWRALDPISGAAALLAAWSSCGAADAIGGAAGRALAACWARRTGAAALPLVPAALGFRGRLGSYTPGHPAWPARFAGALAAGLGEALGLLDRLGADHAALTSWAKARRRPGSAARLVEALFAAGALNAVHAGRRVGLSDRAASDALAALAATPYVAEISGRKSWRVYAPAALVR